MFHSATLKLTGWYLLILMTISLIFSVVIYTIVSNELDDRLEQLQSRFEHSGVAIPFDGLHNPTYTAFRADQNTRATTNLLISLTYVNLLIFGIGGASSYLLARRTLRDIEAAHEAQSRFASDASHELRTPLAAMRSEIEVTLRDKSAPKTELRETLESNLEEVDKLTNLSQMLLHLARAEHTDLEMTTISLPTLTKEIVQRYDRTGKRIEVKKSGKVPSIIGNRAGIEELLTILVDNALKYSPDKSLVSIRLAQRGGKAAFEITNTGKGISAEDLPHIFDRFYRADSSRTGGEKSGFGLGLALAKKIVEIHNGELSASSAPGHATTFTVLLPILRK